MARINSPLGTITGSIGNLTFSGKSGDNQIRQKIASNSSNTPAQQEVRKRFKLLSEMYKKLTGAVAAGLKPQGGQSGYNRFMGLNYDSTALGPDGMAMVDYSKLVLSGGSVEPLANVVAALDAQAGKVTVSFADNSNGNTALDTDIVKVVVLNKTTGRAVALSDNDTTRSDASAIVEDAALTGVPAADLVAYTFALRADGSDASGTTAAPVA